MHFALSCCICLPAAQAQEDYRRLFATDPYGSDGYFIPDRRAMANLGIDHIIIDLFAARLNSSNELVIRTFDQVTIQPGQTYGKFDLSKLGTLGSGEQVHYEATGYGSNNSVVITFAATRPGGWAWPAVCYYTCEAASYAYTLTVHSSDFQHYIEITNGTDDGDPFYFYVLASDFQEFRYQFTPSDLGIYGGNWDVILSNTEQDDVIRMIGVPAGARDYYGQALGWQSDNAVVYAIKKMKGPWNQLFAHTQNFSSSSVCTDGDAILYFYNSDEQVQNALQTLNAPALGCAGMPSTDGAVSQDGSYLDDCTEFTYAYDTETLDVVEWAVEAVDCTDPPYEPEDPTAGSGTNPVERTHSVLVNKWSADGISNEITIPFPNVKDGKLVPVKKTQLQPGLYEFLIVLDNGRIIRKFQDFRNTVTIEADFASFVHINVYPVPVKDKMFSIDFDSVTPLNVNIQIVDNHGVQRYTKAESFQLAGRNKHVVFMDYEWPDGLYHGIFTYGDGSSSTVSFLVE